MKTKKNPLQAKNVLLLDMNSTFMFEEDRFDDDQDYFQHYSNLNGELGSDEVNRLIREAYAYLEERYPEEEYRTCFPSVESALREVSGASLVQPELDRLVQTFAYHERGVIPDDYRSFLHRLRSKFLLCAVIDIWAPRDLWMTLFEDLKIRDLFSAVSFSSDHGIVKPSPIPFQMVLKSVSMTEPEALVIGDSVRRDLGGAVAAGLDCLLVGGSTDPRAIGALDSLLDLEQYF